MFEILASSTADSRTTILPLVTTSKSVFSSAIRSAFHSICLLQTDAATVRSYTRQLKYQRTRRLLVSFRDLDSTPTDNTLIDLLDAVCLRDLVLYLCEGAKIAGFVAALKKQELATLDYGSFTSVVTFSFPEVCEFVARLRHLQSLSWEVVGILAELPKDFAVDKLDRSESKVTTLHITCPAITDDALLFLVDLVRPTLRVLKIKTTANSTLLTPHGIERALSYLPSLETLTLDIASPSTPSSSSSLPLEKIIGTLPSLRHLSLTSALPLATIAGLARLDNELESLHLGRVDFVGAFEEKMLALSRTSMAFPKLRLLRIELDGRTISSEEGATSMEASLKELWGLRSIDFVLTRTVLAGGNEAIPGHAVVVSV